jgi:hypothetical protein
VPEAPVDTKTYGRKDAGWIEIPTASVLVADTPPAGAPDKALWWESDTGMLYIRYNDGDSSQWVAAVAVPSVEGFVQKTGDTMTGPLVLAADPTAALGAATKQMIDKAVSYAVAQALTAAQQTQARANIAAAPIDALAYSGMQINGSTEVSQERGATALALAAVGQGSFYCDQWQVYSMGAAVSVQQVADAPPGFASSIKFTVTTAKAVLAATDQTLIYQNIEGYRVSRLAFGNAAAQSVTIAFWSKIHRTGTYGGSLKNGLAPVRSYPFTFTQNVADARIQNHYNSG